MVTALDEFAVQRSEFIGIIMGSDIIRGGQLNFFIDNYLTLKFIIDEIGKILVPSLRKEWQNTVLHLAILDLLDDFIEPRYRTFHRRDDVAGQDLGEVMEQAGKIIVADTVVTGIVFHGTKVGKNRHNQHVSDN